MANREGGESSFSALMVDDDPSIQDVGRKILEHCGCRVEVSESGQEAVAATARQRYDIIFMDCHMPKMDGYEATRAIRERENKSLQNSSTNRIPIIALTGYSTEQDREKCLQAGMDDYLSKPFRIADIRSILDRWLSGRPDPIRKVGEGAASSGEARRESDKGLGPQEGTPPIDWSVLEKMIPLQPPGSETLLKRVISLYLDTSLGLMKEIRAAVEGSDADALHRSAHTLKSSSAYLGALAFSGICKELELMGRGKALAEAKERLAALEKEYRRVRESLERRCASLP